MSGLWEIFWFFLPAGIANMSPVLANKIPGLNRWNTPIDLGKSWHGKRIFGNNKTWRGLLFGTLVGSLVGLIQYRVIASSSESTIFIIAATGLMGFGALVGDAVESFFKRQRGVAPGHSWFPFDQIDFIIGGLLFSYLLVPLPLIVMLLVVMVYTWLHVVTSYIAYLLKLKDRPI